MASPVPHIWRTVVRLLAEIEKNPLSSCGNLALRDSCIDDIATSIETEEDAVDLHHKLIDLFKSGGFFLAKWNMNSGKLNQFINIHSQDNFLFDTENHTKVLGLHFDGILLTITSYMI